MRYWMMLFFLSTLTLAQPTLSDPSIHHLLNTIKESPCTFYRNGKSYRSPDVVKHVKFKADYFKEKINSAETFIQYAATKSEMSGQEYLIECPDFKMPMGEWLIQELTQYRKNQDSKS